MAHVSMLLQPHASHSTLVELHLLMPAAVPALPLLKTQPSQLVGALVPLPADAFPLALHVLLVPVILQGTGSHQTFP